MPRLRKMKSFDVVEVVGDSDSGVRPQDSRHEVTEQADGWLSTPRMMASLAEDELRSAWEFHKAQVILYEAELRGRLDGSRVRQPLPIERDLNSIQPYDLEWLAPWRDRKASQSRGRREKRPVHKLSREARVIARLVAAGVQPQAVVDFIREYLQSAAGNGNGNGKLPTSHECSASEQPSSGENNG